MAAEIPPRRLADIAFGRAGDKGNIANLSVIARAPEHWPILLEQVTVERVQDWLGPLAPGRVERFELPTLHALNFVLHDALDGGATLSLRLDPLGKSLAGALLMLPIAI